MKRGFTLLELLIVIIIVGVLATIGFTQYTAVVERSRGSEARQVLGSLRTLCAGIWMRDRNTASCSDANLNIIAGGGVDSIPGAGVCANTHFFHYAAVPGATADLIQFTATRCAGATGKPPSGDGDPNKVLTLDVDYSGTPIAGSNPPSPDVWTSVFGY